MPKKNWFGILILIILIQIAFSFYYSSEIITQNNIFAKNQNQYDQLKKLHQSLENQQSQLNSFQYLQDKINSINFIPIKKTLNLND